MDLVIMAGGLGSRFGGLKQVEGINSSNEFIIDYSIFDAVKCGFDRVVFIIQKKHKKLFKSSIGKRVSKYIKTKYVFQSTLDLPKGFKKIDGREKPLGTAHAIWCCRKVVKNSFAIINADDFYGRNAFEVVSEFLKKSNNKDMCLVGYEVSKTLSANGATKRGVCKQDKNGYLTTIEESSIERIKDKIVATSLNNGKSKNIKENDIVSMNMFGFKPEIFNVIDKQFKDFLNSLNEENKLKSEFLIPNVVQNAISSKVIKVKTNKTNAKWFGVTYKEDKKEVVNALKQLTKKGVYSNPVWK